MLKPVYTEPDNCQDCYKCIRECPVKAIKVEGNKASIIEERCIYCGHCTQVCPTGAKKIRDGLTRARMVIERYPGKVYLSLAPSCISEFGAETSTALISSNKRLGFAGVSETALGAEIVSSATEDFFVDAKNGVYISSACPVVVEYIRKYAVGHLPGIVPIVSPMIAHAKLLKELYGDDIKIIFAGPCVGKKSESDECPELIDVAITFRDLREWLDSDGAVAEEPSPDLSEGAFIPFTSRRGALYPVEGGMLAGMKTGSTAVRSMSFSDLETVREVLESLDPAQMDYTLFLELLACRGGWINGPARLCQTSPALNRNRVMERGLDGEAVKDCDRLDISMTVVADPPNEAHH